MTDIFIRTCQKDYPWLVYAVASLARYATGYRDLIIAHPATEPPPTLSLGAPSSARIIAINDLPNGYIGQQLTKMEAPIITDATHIMYWDSDCIACRPFNVEKEYLDGMGRVMLLCSSWSAIGPGAMHWLPVTRDATGYTSPYEFMRAIPIMHHAGAIRDTVSVIEQHTGRSIREYLASVEANRFSEFNAIGVVAFMRHKKSYRFLVAEDNHLDHPAHQFWSHGGLGDSERSIIHSLIGLPM